MVFVRWSSLGRGDRRGSSDSLNSNLVHFLFGHKPAQQVSLLRTLNSLRFPMSRDATNSFVQSVSSVPKPTLDLEASTSVQSSPTASLLLRTIEHEAAKYLK